MCAHRKPSKEVEDLAQDDWTTVQEAIYARRFELVYRLCFLYLKNKSDAEDAAAATFVRMLEHQPAFESQDHEKAWLIVTARNVCKNELRSKRRKHLTLDDATSAAAEPSGPDETLAVLLTLPERYQTALYLYYYEGYSTAETAKLMRKNESTVRTYLARGRALLKARLTE